MHVDESVLTAAIERLSSAGCVAAAEEAVELLAAVTDELTLESWIARREQGEPLAWITGTTRFCGLTAFVDAGVYEPRIQSEELANRAAGLLPTHGRAVDLCTGAGVIAAYLQSAVPTATVIGVDVDPRAAACARRNGVPTLVGDLAAPIRAGAFDVVTAVAPYVPTDAIRLLPADVQRYEPRVALDGGDDGLDLVRRVITAAHRLLRPGGWLVTEIGGEQFEDLQPTLADSGFDLVTPWYDDEGDLRGISVSHSGILNV